MVFHIQVLMSRDTILTFSYHIANDTWPDKHYRIAANASPDAHCVIALCRHTEWFNVTRSSYTLTSLRVTLSRDFSPERHPSIRHIHVRKKKKTNKTHETKNLDSHLIGLWDSVHYFCGLKQVMMLQHKWLSNTFAPTKNELNGPVRKLHKQKLYDLCRWAATVTVDKWRLQWAGCVGQMKKKRTAHSILMQKPFGMISSINSTLP